MKISASIVLYHSDFDTLKNLIKSIYLSENSVKLYLVDNSKDDSLRVLEKENVNIVYIYNNENVGFGKGHNIALKKAIENFYEYHFVINPDIIIDPQINIINRMVEYMVQNKDIGMLMPKILNEDGTIQYLPKLLPSPIDIFIRKFKRPKSYYNSFIENYELRFVDPDVVYTAPILSGCFTLFKLGIFQKIGFYDDRFFMYFEDWDISRRVNEKYKTVYFPLVYVYHGYESGANKSKKLFKIFVNSAICYFNKWGWMYDKNRKRINANTINQFK